VRQASRSSPGSGHTEAEMTCFGCRREVLHYECRDHLAKICATGHYYHWLPPRNYTDIATISVVRHS